MLVASKRIVDLGTGDALQIFGIGEGETFTAYEPRPFEVEYEEAVLQNWLGANPNGILEDEKMLVLGREVGTSLGGRIDLLGLDREGNVVVVELKRDDTPRDVIAQALEYAAWASELAEEELKAHFKGDDSLSMAERHARYFGLGDAVVEDFNKGHRIVIVGQDVTDGIRCTASYLNKQGIRLSCREFTLFQSDDGGRLLHLATVVPEGHPSNRERTATDHLISRFWAGLLEHTKPKTRLHANRKPGKEHFLHASAGPRIKDVKLTFYYWVRAHDADVVLYINGLQQERVFNALARNKEEIEDRFGSELDWDPKEGKGHCRIQKTYDGGYQDEASWKEIFDVLASAMASLESAVKPHLRANLLNS